MRAVRYPRANAHGNTGHDHVSDAAGGVLDFHLHRAATAEMITPDPAEYMQRRTVPPCDKRLAERSAASLKGDGVQCAAAAIVKPA